MISILDYLEEATGTTVIKRGKGQKRAALAGAGAMRIAKELAPGLYKQYTMFNQKRLDLKERIQRQFGSRAMAMAKKQMR